MIRVPDWLWPTLTTVAWLARSPLPALARLSSKGTLMLAILEDLKTAARLALPLVDVLHDGKTDTEKQAEMVALLKPEVDVLLDGFAWGELAAYKPFVKGLVESDAVLEFAVKEAWSLGALVVAKAEALVA